MAKLLPFWSRRRTPDELEKIMQRQLGHLRRSAAAYDSGTYEEAERLSNSVYLFVVTTAFRIRGLLDQLKLLDELRFVDSRCNIVPGLPLASIKVDGDFGWYDARYDWKKGKYPEVPFSEWWKQDIHLRKGVVSRETLTVKLRNTDGGGHVDAELKDEHYELFQTDIIPSFVIVDGRAVVRISHSHRTEPKELPPHIPNAHWASMRQIAWELEETLRRAGY